MHDAYSESTSKLVATACSPVRTTIRVFCVSCVLVCAGTTFAFDHYTYACCVRTHAAMQRLRGCAHQRTNVPTYRAIAIVEAGGVLVYYLMHT